MKISVKDLSFGFGEREIFKNLSFETGPLQTGNNGSNFPIVVLGPSGCGKTTLLRLIAGLVRPSAGEVAFAETGPTEAETGIKPNISFVFQEPRLLPQLSILKNTALPLEKIYGKDQAADIARNALKSLMLEEFFFALPDELSGGQKQRASLARAFACPSEVLLMDEPFQSLDIPLRLSLMDETLSLLSQKKRLAVIVTHDTREAIYLGGRIIVLGTPPSGIVFDEEINLSRMEREFGSAAAGELEKELLNVLGG